MLWAVFCGLLLVGCSGERGQVYREAGSTAHSGAEGPAEESDWRRPLFFPDREAYELSYEAEGSWVQRRNELTDDVEALVVTAKFPRHPIVADEINLPSKISSLDTIDAMYQFTIRLPVLRVERVQVESNLPAVPATLKTFVPPEARKRYAPRAAWLLEFELAVFAVWRGGDDYESALRVRSRLVHRVDDRDIEPLVVMDPAYVKMDDQWSWLQPARVEGPEGHIVGNLDPRPLFVHVWNEVRIPVPLDSLGWLKPWFNRFACGEDQPGTNLVLLRGCYSPKVSLWALEAQQKNRE